MNFLLTHQMPQNWPVFHSSSLPHSNWRGLQGSIDVLSQLSPLG
ncbi:MAG: hypothetical protein R3F06_16635 [Nitrosomonas sp.]